MSLRSRRQPPGLRCPGDRRPPPCSTAAGSRAARWPSVSAPGAGNRPQGNRRSSARRPRAHAAQAQGNPRWLCYSWRLLASIYFLNALAPACVCSTDVRRGRLRQAPDRGAPPPLPRSLHHPHRAAPSYVSESTLGVARASASSLAAALTGSVPLPLECCCTDAARAAIQRVRARGHGCAIITEERECSGICRPPLGARRDSLVTAEASRLCAGASDTASAAGQAQRRGSVLAQ